MQLKNEVELNNSFILNKNNLEKIYKFLSKNYNEIDFNIIIRNWTEIKLSYQDLLSYDNYNDEKIIELNIECYKKEKDNIYNSLTNKTLYIRFWDKDCNSMFERKTIRYTLKSDNKDNYSKIENELNDILKNEFKTWYNIFNNWYLYWITNISIIMFLLFKVIDTNNFTQEQQVNSSILFFVISFLIVQSWFYKKIYRFFFPKFIFWIWKQFDDIKKRDYWRKFIFASIIVAIIINKIS